MKFKIYSGDNLIGRSSLEHGDPPMGMAFGVLQPSGSYPQVQATFRALYDHLSDVPPELRREVEALSLRAESEDGEVISDGVGVLDPRNELPDEPPEVEVRCRSAEVYRRHFPHHWTAYDERFPP